MKTLREHFEAWQAELGDPTEMRLLAATAFLVGVSSTLAALSNGQTTLEVATDMAALLAEADELFRVEQRATAERN